MAAESPRARKDGRHWNVKPIKAQLSTITSTRDDFSAVMTGMISISSEAGLAIVRYELASLRWIFGDALGDEAADKLYQAIRQAGTNGLSLSEQSKTFGRNTAKADLDRARKILTERGRIETYEVATDGRRETRHRARLGDATPTKETKETKEAPSHSVRPPLLSSNSFLSYPDKGKRARAVPNEPPPLREGRELTDDDAHDDDAYDDEALLF